MNAVFTLNDTDTMQLWFLSVMISFSTLSYAEMLPVLSTLGSYRRVPARSTCVYHPLCFQAAAARIASCR
jgi:hypothetical protein